MGIPAPYRVACRQAARLFVVVLLAGLALGGIGGRPAWAASNVALRKIATGSVACSTAEQPWFANNGSTADRWCSRAPGTKFLQIELQDEYDVSSFVIRHAGAGGQPVAGNTRAFSIQVGFNTRELDTVVTVTDNSDSVTTHPIATRAMRVIRLNITTPTQTADDTAVIYEFEAYGDRSPFPGENFALNRPAAGSAPCRASETPDKAVNGSITGGNSDKWCSRVQGVKFLQVDLQSQRVVTGVRVWHAGAGGERVAWNTRDFDIQVSTDGVTFTTLRAERGNLQSMTFIGFQHRSVRYVRLNIITPTSDGNKAARIYDLAAYPNALPPTPPAPPLPPPPPATPPQR